MAEINLAAETGRPTGSRASGRLRAEGRVPGVVYGLGKDPVAVSVVWRELRQTLVGDAGLNALIDLHVDGGDTELVMVKELQRHPVRRDVLHVDFLRVSRDQELTVDVPIVLEGEATKVLSNDGSVDQVLHALTVHAKPQSIPNELTVDVSDLALGDVIRVGDIALPAGVTTSLDPEEPVVSTSGAMALEIEGEAPEGEAEGEAEEGAEAAEAAGEGGEGDESGAAEGDTAE